MLSVFNKLFEDWNNHNVQYCNWKGTSKIDKGLEGLSDSDILIGRESKKQAEATLLSNGFVHVQTQSFCRYTEVFDWLGLDRPTGRMVHVHLHYRMIAGHPGIMEYTIPWEKNVLSSRVLLENNVYSIDPNWEMAVFLTRIGLEYPNKKIDKHIISLTSDAHGEFRYIRERVDESKLTEIMKLCYPYDYSSMIILSNKERLEKKDFILLRRLTTKYFSGYWFNIFSKFRSRLKTAVRVYLIPKVKNLFHITTKKTLKKGVVLAFLGQDGSGKSTVSKDIKKWLDSKLEVRRFYLGSGEHFNPWEKRLGERLSLINNPVVKRIRSVLAFRQVKKIADYAYRNIKKAFKYKEKGGIALLDRFPQVQYPSINDGPKLRTSILPKVTSSILKNIVSFYATLEEKKLAKAVKYNPDIVFKFMLSPEESLRRKPQENYESVCRKHEIIKSLEFPNSKVFVIDATQPYEQELIQIKNIIWDNIQKS